MVADVDELAPFGARSFLSGFIALWAFSAAVSAMPVPVGGSSAWYRWLYQFAHLLAANLDKAGLPVQPAASDLNDNDARTSK